MFKPFLNPGYAEDVVPSDTTDLDYISVIFIGTGGDIEVIPANGDGVTSVIFKNCPNAFELPVKVRRVKAAGTTATDMIAQHNKT